MSLTDEQCAEIAKWSSGVAALGPAPRIVVDRDREPGRPERIEAVLHAHPDDYLALKRWSDRMARFDL